MRVEFIGGAGTVTGSKSILMVGEDKFLIDCGMFQGEGEVSLLNRRIDYSNFSGVENIFLTHAHYDHIGFLPYLFNHGKVAKIYCTELTKKLMEVILNDSLSIQEYEFKHNKVSEIDFTEEDIRRVLNSVVVINFEEVFEVKGCNVCFYETGHILGASSILFESKITDESILFSGDLGRDIDHIHVAPKLPDCADTLVVESTYGDRLHPKIDPIIKLKKYVAKIKETEGILLIPSFAIARTQILLKLINDLIEIYPEMKIPVFLDSPMAVKVTKIYQDNCSELKLKEAEFEKIMSNVKLIEYGNDTKKLKRKKGPYILISSSGMINGGRVVNHFKSIANKDANVILMAGFQGDGTIGRQLLNGDKLIKVEKESIKIRAEIDMLENVSAHADQEELIRWIQEIKDLKNIFINHGEVESSIALKEKLETLGKYKVVIAKPKRIEGDF